ncbi:hypothetical protein [Paenibacillus sp. yr247]|uniref:hypothetical protein n=1 Tax=Paenibacillus sp. yr247 TaxID=1761880 RepID=UPI000B8997FE|nr:hypothetical protein [Paenibacillus sp. yr247]
MKKYRSLFKLVGKLARILVGLTNEEQYRTCAHKKVSITELREIQHQVTEQIDEFKSQGIIIYTVSVDEEKRKVIVGVESITEEQRTKLLKQYGQNKIDFC